MKATRIAGLSALVFALAVSAGWAQEEQPWKTGKDLMRKAAKGEEEGLPKLLTEHHERLAQMAGTWSGQTRIWMGAETVDSRSFAVSDLVMDNRFLRTDYKGQLMGQSVLGLGLSGYDTATEEHVSVWADSTGTAILTFRGKCNEDGSVITMYAETVNPENGKTVKSRSITQIQSTSRYTYELSTLGEDGEYAPVERIIFSKQ